MKRTPTESIAKVIVKLLDYLSFKMDVLYLNHSHLLNAHGFLCENLATLSDWTMDGDEGTLQSKMAIRTVWQFPDPCWVNISAK